VTPPALFFSKAGRVTSGFVKLVGVILAGVALAGQQINAAPRENLWDLQALASPPEVFPAPEIPSSDDRIRSLFFAGPTYRSQPTRVFAWLGVPKLAESAKAPGIVLLHGAGGTAFESWVKLWVDRGYAAIAIDHWGTLPLPVDAKPRPRNPAGGPAGGSAAFAQLDEPLQDQWPFQAATAAILAHSLLLAQPGVDPERTGVTGVSWGGYLTCLLAGLDPRLKFAAPIYGCGHYEDTIFADQLAKLPADQSALWYAQWDAKNYIPDIRIPVLWVNGTNDKYFWPPAWQKSHRQMPDSLTTLSLRVNMKHGHPPAGDPPEIRAFADSQTGQGQMLPKITGLQRIKQSVTVDFQSSEPPSRAELSYTTDASEPWAKRRWLSVPASLSDHQAHAVLPSEARLYYMSIWNKNGALVSSRYEEQP
jgi:dienelactone hydrolase